MKASIPEKIEKYRVKNGLMGSTKEYGNNGFFLIPRSVIMKKTKNNMMKVMISDLEGWDHVSVSFQSRIPTWKEMCFVKDLFFNPEETVIQFHPPESKYVNTCKYCLHMWRNQNQEIILPPKNMIG